jgi:hypothetical protein
MQISAELDATRFKLQMAEQEISRIQSEAARSIAAVHDKYAGILTAKDQEVTGLRLANSDLVCFRKKSLSAFYVQFSG